MLLSSPSPRVRSYAPLRVERRECGFGARARARAAAASDDAAAEDARTRETRARSESHAHATTTKKETTRRRNIAVIMASTGVAMSIARAREAEAEYGDAVYMESLQGAGKDYGKSEILYSDFARTRSGLQYKDVREGVANAATYDGERGAIAIVDWDGYTIGYYGRPFEARNKSKGGAFTGEDKDFFRFTPNDANVIGAFREAVIGMKVGSIRRIIVPPNSALGYPDGKKWRSMKPQPSNFSGERALGFVLENQGMIDKTLLFDIELVKIQ